MGFVRGSACGGHDRATQRIVRFSRGDTSVRFVLDRDLGWVVELASSRWGGGWCEAEIVIRAEHVTWSAEAMPTLVLSAISRSFDGLPATPQAASLALDRMTST